MPVLPSDIAALMQRSFKDRVEIKAEMLRQAREAAQGIGGSTSLQALKDSSITAPTTRVRRRIGLFIGIAVVVLALLGLAVLVFRPDPSPSRVTPSPRSAAPPPPRKRQVAQVHIVLQATPASASIQFDGANVSNPFESHLRKEPRKASTKITAPGYVPKSFEVSLGESGRWIVALEKISPKQRPRGARRRRRSPGRAKPKPKVIKDLLSNPYGQ